MVELLIKLFRISFNFIRINIYLCIGFFHFFLANNSSYYSNVFLIVRLIQNAFKTFSEQSKYNFISLYNEYLQMMNLEFTKSALDRGCSVAFLKSDDMIWIFCVIYSLSVILQGGKFDMSSDIFHQSTVMHISIIQRNRFRCARMSVSCTYNLYARQIPLHIACSVKYVLKNTEKHIISRQIHHVHLSRSPDFNVFFRFLFMS